MKELTIDEQTLVNGGTYEDLFLAALPVLGVSLKGIGLCYALNLPYRSALPTIGLTALFSAAGAIIGKTEFNNYTIGSMAGGLIGMYVSVAFGVNKLA